MEKRKAPGGQARGESNSCEHDTIPSALVNPETGEKFAVAGELSRGENVYVRGPGGEHHTQTFFTQKETVTQAPGTVKIKSERKIPSPRAGAYRKMTLSGLRGLVYIEEYIQYRTNILQTPSHRKATYETLARALGLSVNQTRDIIRELEQNDLLVRYRNRKGRVHFLVNPNACYRGEKECRVAVIDAYKEGRKDELDEEGIQTMEQEVKVIADILYGNVIPFPA